MRRFTVAERAYRASIWVRFDARFAIFKSGSRVGQAFQRRFEKGLEEMVSPELSREALIPDYTIGCKRILISNDWYPTLLRAPRHGGHRPRRAGRHPSGVVAAGEEHPVDTIIFGTGFQSTGFLAPMQITGRDGLDLHTSWKDGAEAHPRHHGQRLPEPVRAVRAEHEPRPQLDHLHARAADPVRDRVHRGARRARPRLARREARGAGRLQRAGPARARRTPCGATRATAGTRPSPARSRTTGRARPCGTGVARRPRGSTTTCGGPGGQPIATREPAVADAAG